MNSLVGQMLGNCLVQESLGLGGMGQVYKGLQVPLNRPVAIKVMLEHLTSNTTFVARFRLEAQAASTLKHPNVIGVYDFNQQGDLLYLVMEYMDGGTLGHLLHQYTDRPLSLSVGLDLVRQAAEGLAAAQNLGMIHRDIKPDNLLLSWQTGHLLGEDRYILKISDFGLARLVEGNGLTASNTGRLIGTMHYFSPEQCEGKNLDGRSDLYSLGIVLYEVVTGRRPFQINNFVDAVNKHIYDIAPSPRLLRPDLPLAVEEIVMRCLAKSPEDRYQTGIELSLAIQSVLSSLSRSDGDLGTPLQAPSTPEKEAIILSQRHIPTRPPIPPQPQTKSSFLLDQIASRNNQNRVLTPTVPSNPQPQLEQSAITPSPASHDSQPTSGETKYRVFPNDQNGLPTPTVPSNPQPQLEQSTIILPPDSDDFQPTSGKRKYRALPLLSFIGGMVVVLLIIASLFASGILPNSKGGSISKPSITRVVKGPISKGTAPSLNQGSTGITPTSMPSSIQPPAPTPTPAPYTPTLSNPAAYYAWATSGSPYYHSSMTQEDNFHWYQGSRTGYESCTYANNAFEEMILNPNDIVHCYEHVSQFTNLTFQAQITIRAGDGGGLLFRSNPNDNSTHTPEYRFYVYTDGSYALVTSYGTLSSGSSGQSVGLNNTVTITAIAQGTTITLYLNGQQLTTLNDGTASSGIVGLSGADVSQQTTVDFTNVSIWQR